MTMPATCPPPSRLHELMRRNRTQLISRYLLLMPGLPEVGKRAVCDYWTREHLADAIERLEREEAPADVAHDG